MEDFIKSLGIDKQGKQTDDDRYIIEVSSIMELNDYYNILTNSEDIEEDQETSKVSVEVVDINFIGKNFDINLYGNIDEEEYTLTVVKK